MSRSLRLVTALALLGAGVVAAQSLERRIAAAPDGQIRFTYAAREGVAGNGRGVISWNCRNGRCDSNRINDRDWDDSRGTPCDSGPVRVALRMRGGTPTSLRVYVGGEWLAPGAGVTDLGTVSAVEASHYLLGLAAANRGDPSREAVFAATLADSVTIWPDLLRMAKNAQIAQETRKSAVFWLGQAAGDAATKGLDDLIQGDEADREVQKSAVFALSQRPRDEGVPVLIRVAKSHRDPEVRRSAIFWLGQSNDPRALALFEELLTRP